MIFCVSAPDRTLEELIRHWNNADVPLSEKKVDAIIGPYSGIMRPDFHLVLTERAGSDELYRLWEEKLEPAVMAL